MLLWALLTACEDKLDITPKGMTVLGKVDELETLLNQSYGFGAVTDLGIVCNECYSSFENAATALSVPNTLKYLSICELHEHPAGQAGRGGRR